MKIPELISRDHDRKIGECFDIIGAFWDSSQRIMCEDLGMKKIATTFTPPAHER